MENWCDNYFNYGNSLYWSGCIGYIFTCPIKCLTYYGRFIVQNSQACVCEVKKQLLSNHQHNTSEVAPLKTYYRSPTLQRQAVTSHHRWPCASQSSWHRCRLNLPVTPQQKDVYREVPMARASPCSMMWLEKESAQLIILKMINLNHQKPSNSNALFGCLFVDQGSISISKLVSFPHYNCQTQSLPPVMPKENTHTQGTSSLPVFKGNSYGMCGCFLLTRLIWPS